MYERWKGEGEYGSALERTGRKKGVRGIVAKPELDRALVAEDI